MFATWNFTVDSLMYSSCAMVLLRRHAGSVVSYGRHQLGEAELPAGSDPA